MQSEESREFFCFFSLAREETHGRCCLFHAENRLWVSERVAVRGVVVVVGRKGSAKGKREDAMEKG